MPWDPVVSVPLWVDAVSVWCEAVRGDISFDAALAGVLTAAKGEAGMLVRRRIPSRRYDVIARCDWREGQSNSVRKAFGNDVFGEDLARARNSTVWLQSVHNPAGTDDLREFHNSRDLRDFAVLILSSSSVECDHLELHFRHSVSSIEHRILTEATGVLSRNWETYRRGKGSIITRSLHDIEAEPVWGETIVLSDSNSFGLTKAEFRVCFELAQGRSFRGLCDELNLAPSTVRAHLRGIFGKTGTSNLIELLFLLMGGVGAEARSPKRGLS